MKKQWATVMAILLAGAMCLGIAACGGKTSPSEDDDTNTSSPEEFVSAKVTAEQWAAAVAYLKADEAQYTVKVEGSVKCELTNFPDPEAEGQTISGTCSFGGQGFAIKNGTKEYVKQEYEEAGDEKVIKCMGIETNTESYSEKTEEGIYCYTQENGVWKKKLSSSAVFSRDFAKYFSEYDLDLEHATYSEEKKGYVCSETDDLSVDGPTVAAENVIAPKVALSYEIVVKFNAEGKIAAMIFSMVREYSGEKTDEFMTYSVSYEAAEITLPAVAD